MGDSISLSVSLAHNSTKYILGRSAANVSNMNRLSSLSKPYFNTEKNIQTMAIYQKIKKPSTKEGEVSRKASLRF